MSTVGERGLEMITPLYWWSALVHETSAISIESGKALAYTMNGNQPTPEAIASIRQRLHQAFELLERGESMHQGEIPAHLVVDLTRPAAPPAAPAPSPSSDVPGPALLGLAQPSRAAARRRR